MIAFRMAGCSIFFLLYLLCGCRADSSSSMHIDAHERRTESTVKNDIIIRPNALIDGDSDKYQYILTRLESWMKEKRKKDKRNQQYDEDITMMARPFVTLAFAQTLDGMIATKSTESGAVTSNLILSCPQSTILTHHLRNIHNAILIGGSTFLADQPRMNVRLPSEHTPSGGVRHPIPIILDTNLHYLQRLIFSNWEPSQLTTSLLQSILSNDQNLPEIMLENIRAHHPIICCSSIAAQTFLDILEILFQEDDPSQPRPKRKRKKSYKISVYKKIDVQNDHKIDNYMPIKITIHIIYHNKHKDGFDDTKQDITLTLLPCRIDNKSNSLDLRHVLNQLYNQFEIESVMVEGGACILSSFLNECVLGERTKSVESTTRAGNEVVDCICVTIAPKIIGGKWGLPVLGKFDILPASGSKPENGGECGLEDEECMMLCKEVMAIKEGEFLSLGKDCTFLGRI